MNFIFSCSNKIHIHARACNILYLSTFEKNKTPGKDGLTIEFHKFFSPNIGTLLVDPLNYAHFHWELSNTQKQVVIALSEKKDKDGRLIKDWRPISLLNLSRRR